MTKKQKTHTIAVDFDATISEFYQFELFKMGPPLEGAKQFLEALHRRGYRILIYSCRAKGEKVVKSMEDYMHKHELPFDKIFEKGYKPAATAYVDDRGVSCQPQKEGVFAYNRALGSIEDIIIQKNKEKAKGVN